MVIHVHLLLPVKYVNMGTFVDWFGVHDRTVQDAAVPPAYRWFVGVVCWVGGDLMVRPPLAS